MQDRAGAILSEAEKKEGNADKKLAKANQLIIEYQTTLAKEAAQVKRQIQKKLQEESDRVLRRRTRQLSGMTIVLLVSYLIQMMAVLIIEKDIVMTIPTWFRNRCRNILWLLQCMGDFYQRLYLKMTTAIPPRVAIGILILVSVIIAVVCFFSYPYGLTLYAATMEESVGILRLHGCGLDKEMCNGRNCSYGTVNFNGGGRFAICTIQIQCGKLVDFD